jgi:hypothetical protein
MNEEMLNVGMWANWWEQDQRKGGQARFPRLPRRFGILGG